ncbi:MAG TPA: response regulator, partial [Blastocatellia bacterium]|nr:response regulator [Blastocatellia bacterium]
MKNRECTVLIVDDTVEDRLTCRRYLNSDTEWRFIFLEAEMGERGVELCLEAQPDCVLLDYQLPDMDGLEVLAALANGHGELNYPVVMMTGTDEVKLAVEAMKLGAQDFINKNRLTPIDLQRAVHNAIERVALRREAKENEQRFRTLTEAIPQLVWTCDSSGSCDYLSNRWLQYTGTELEENLGLGWFKHIHPDDLLHAQEIWEQAVTGGKAYEVEMRLRRADGVYRWHLVRSLPIANLDSQTVKWFGTCTDIEERKRVERESEQSLEREQLLRAQAEQANRLKDEFLATISHELRTPLSNSYGWVKMLRLGQVPPQDAPRALEIVERNMQAQNKLIEDLLDVSRIITGKMRLDVREIEFREVIERAINAAQPAAVAKGVNLQVLIGPGSNTISGDPDRLQQIAWNLISNAIKFTPSGGTVTVCIEHGKASLRLVVRDTGEGIAPEFLHHVFERF